MRTARYALLLICLSTLPAVACAQITDVTNSTSTPTPGSGHDYLRMLNETVNPSNGSVSIRISTPVPPGRQLSVPFAFEYDSNGALILTSSPSGNRPGFGSTPTFLSRSGWSYAVPLLSADYLDKIEQLPNGRNITCRIDKDFVFQDLSGGRHTLRLAGTQHLQISSCTEGPFLSGGDAFVKAFKSNCVGANCPVSVANEDGTVYAFNGPFDFLGANQSGSSLPTSIEDRNGNKVVVTTNSGTTTFTDTAGRSAVSFSGFGTNGSTVNISGLAPYTVSWGTAPTNFSVNQVVHGQPNPLCWTLADASGSLSIISAITLPNGKQYQFSYHPTYGMLSQITYPDGGWIKYDWSLNPQSEFGTWPDQNGNAFGCGATYDWPRIQHRYVSFDGTHIALQQDFSYSISWNSAYQAWVTKQTIVTTHDCAQNNFNCSSAPAFTTTYSYLPVTPTPQPFTFQNFAKQIPLESTVVYGDWNGTTLKTSTKTWYDQDRMGCESATLGSSGPISRVDYSYQVGLTISDKKEWDWGQAPTCGR